MRDTDAGLSNGNPVRALIEDGLPGANIAQVGLASFANSAAMHRDAVAAGNLVVTIGEVRAQGIAAAIGRALDHVAHCDALVIDCDIDVIDRAQLPGAPGARPGGMAVGGLFRRGAAAGGGAAGAGDRPDRMGPGARPQRPQRADRGALAGRVPRRATSCAEAQPNSSASSDGRSSGASWSKVHCAGALSGRQRRRPVPWRKRRPVTWS